MSRQLKLGSVNVILTSPFSLIVPLGRFILVVAMSVFIKTKIYRPLRRRPEPREHENSAQRTIANIEKIRTPLSGVWILSI